MASQQHRPEAAVAKLRQVDVLVSQGRSVAEAIRAIGVTEVTYYRWRREFGGLKGDQVKRLKDLEAEDARLRQAVAELTLDKQILAEAARGNFQAPRAGAPASSLCDGSCPSPSAAPARRSASTARRSARRRGAATTKSASRPTSSSWHGSTAATATARSPNCCDPRRIGS
jgi:putative transposase